MKLYQMCTLIILCSLEATTKPVGGYSSEADCLKDCPKGECRFIDKKYQCLKSASVKKPSGFN